MRELFGGLDQAVYDTVHDYVDGKTRKRGAVALAPKLGLQPGTLANKANPQQEHQLTLREAVPLMLATQDFRILEALAAELGHTLCALPDGDISDIELLTQYATFQDAIGRKAASIRHALEDHVITPAEAREIREAFHRVCRAGLAVVSRIEALAGD